MFFSSQKLKFVRQIIDSKIYLFLLLGLLLLPAIWYSVRTPFALIDDYNSWMWLGLLKPDEFIEWIKHLFTFGAGRYRPIFEIYNLITWFVFRENFTLHHLARLALKFASAYFAMKTLILWYPLQPRKFRLSLFVFLALFLFIPNNPEARLAPQELTLVFGTAWFFYSFSRLLSAYDGNLVQKPLSYISIFLSFIVMNGSKESAIAISGVLLATLIVFNYRGIKNWLGLLPFILVFAFSVAKSLLEYQSGGYGIIKVTSDLILANLDWYSDNLLFWKHTPILTGFLVLPVLAGLIIVIRKGIFLLKSWKKEIVIGGSNDFVKTDRNRLVIFINIFLCVFSSFIIILTSASATLRYLFPTVFLMLFLIALSYEEIVRITGFPRKWGEWVIIAGCVYFVWANYYNFMYQFAAQYYTRKNEANMLQTATKLLEDGKTIYVVIQAEYEYKIKDYYKAYLPYFHGKKFDNIRFVTFTQLYDDGIYYLTRNPLALGGHKLREKFISRDDPPFLETIKIISSWAIGGKNPTFNLDGGTATLGDGQWYIYENMVNDELFQKGGRILKNDTVFSLGNGNDMDERTFIFNINLKSNHYYAIKVDYSTIGYAKPYVIVIPEAFDKNNIPLQQDIPLNEAETSTWLAFKPPQYDIPKSLIIFRNWSSEGTFHIRSYEIKDLGEINPPP